MMRSEIDITSDPAGLSGVRLQAMLSGGNSK
jgi:hypothetical protein